MQRVESCHSFAVMHAPREGCRELSLVICLFSCQSKHMSKQRMCKEECKKRTLVIPCSEKKMPNAKRFTKPIHLRSALSTYLISLIRHSGLYHAMSIVLGRYCCSRHEDHVITAGPFFWQPTHLLLPEPI